MSIYLSGTLTRSGGIISAISKQIKLVNLKPVKKIQVQFDPFHPRAEIAREFLFHISTPKLAETNISCLIKTNIVCDRSEPEINIKLTDSSNIKFLAANLSVLDILKLFNKHISSRVKEEEVDNIPITKLQKKKLRKRR